MATNFPDSPSNGATHTFGGTTYTYNSTKGVWTAPASGTTTFAALTDTPSSFSGQGGKTLKVNSAANAVEFSSIAAGDGQSPIVYTEPAATHTLNNDGSTSTVQMQAVDPEGTAITYGIAYANATNARPNQLAADTAINQSTGVFTFDPSTTTGHAGSFKARLSASDGISSASRFVNFSLAFTTDVEYLIIGGGGGGAGGSAAGAGGGAGGYRTATGLSLTAGQTYSVTVGAGGAGNTSPDNNNGSNGGDSVFGGVTSLGGGGGAGTGPASASYAGIGLAGGSGGGGRYGGAGGAGTSGQGNAGGASTSGGSRGSGGGGGAGAAGGDGTSSAGGSGGAGLASSITGTSVTRAGGGGGATWNNTSYTNGGAGGGGNGGHTATAGTANTGGGGGGNGSSVNGQAGGSGVVILRTLGTASATTGSPTVTTDGSYNIYQFNADGSITF